MNTYINPEAIENKSITKDKLSDDLIFDIKGEIPKNEIWYISNDGEIVNPNNSGGFGANIVSNTYENGKGIIKFDGDITSIGESAFYYCKSLTSITIPDSVTSIGFEALYGCTSLTSITIPDSVTSIGSSAFSYCSSLTSVTVPDSVASIGESAFCDCSSLTSVTIPDSVTSIRGSAFYGCSSLTSVTIPDIVTSIGSDAFRSCESLTSVTIPDSVTSIGDNAFMHCASLKSVTIPDSVTDIGYMTFGHCASLTSVTIPDSVTSIGEMAFYDCSNLTSITIPDSVTSIGDYAFEGCSSLTSVTIGNSVTSIGDYAFGGCSSLTSVTIPDSVTSIGEAAFWNHSSLTNINIKNYVPASMGGSVFDFISENSKICIPVGTLQAYISATNWSNYAEYMYECVFEDENLISGQNIKTLNGESILGEGDIKVATNSPIVKGDADNSAVLKSSGSKATASYAFAEGHSTTASGNSSHAEGGLTTASGYYAHAEGCETYSHGYCSHTEGSLTAADGDCSHAEGEMTNAYGRASHAEGTAYNDKNTEAGGHASHAEGGGTKASSEATHAEGLNTVAGRISQIIDPATGNIRELTNEEILILVNEALRIGLITSQSEFNTAVAMKLIGFASHAEGSETKALGTSSHAEGNNTEAASNSSHAEGDSTHAWGEASHAEGYLTEANGNQSHSEGSQTKARGNSSHAEGIETQALKEASHAEGTNTIANGNSSHAEGIETQANGWGSHAEGGYNITTGAFSHIEGRGNYIGDNDNYSTEVVDADTKAYCAHVEGQGTKATGNSAHAEGISTKALGIGSHAEGYYTEANGDYSHASGVYTKATKEAEFACGKYNISDSDTIFSIGDGESDSNRHNIFEIKKTAAYVNSEKVLVESDINNDELNLFKDYIKSANEGHVAIYSYARCEGDPKPSSHITMSPDYGWMGLSQYNGNQELKEIKLNNYDITLTVEGGVNDDINGHDEPVTNILKLTPESLTLNNRPIIPIGNIVNYEYNGYGDNSHTKNQSVVYSDSQEVHTFLVFGENDIVYGHPYTVILKHDDISKNFGIVVARKVEDPEGNIDVGPDPQKIRWAGEKLTEKYVDFNAPTDFIEYEIVNNEVDSYSEIQIIKYRDDLPWFGVVAHYY